MEKRQPGRHSSIPGGGRRGGERERGRERGRDR